MRVVGQREDVAGGSGCGAEFFNDGAGREVGEPNGLFDRRTRCEPERERRNDGVAAPLTSKTVRATDGICSRRLSLAKSAMPLSPRVITTY